MTPNTLLTLFILCYLSTTVTYIYGYQTVFYDVLFKDSSVSGVDNIYETRREKRDIESFDNDDYPSPAAQEEQEEPGFWDRIVRVALKLFNRFIEWLNSS